MNTTKTAGTAGYELTIFYDDGPGLLSVWDDWERARDAALRLAAGYDGTTRVDIYSYEPPAPKWHFRGNRYDAADTLELVS